MCLYVLAEGMFDAETKVYHKNHPSKCPSRQGSAGLHGSTLICNVLYELGKNNDS